MNQSRLSFVTTNEILSDVVKLLKDEDFRLSSQGYYTSLIQQALQELGFDTFFDERNDTFDIPQNGILDMPKGAFNLRQMYVFNGDRCNIGTAKNVYFKRNFIKGNSSGFVARNKGDNAGDPFYQDGAQRSRGKHDVNIYNATRNDINELYFYGIQNGMIMLSDSAKRFDKVMMVFNGTGGEIGEAPIIPTFLRQAVKDWVSNMGLEIKLTDLTGDPSFNAWAAIKSMVDTRLNKEFTGSWAKAESRVKSLDTKEREDYKEYFSKMDIA